MAVGARPARAPEEPRRPARSGRDRPTGGSELWFWLFMRLSGVLLLVLAVGHVVIMHVLGDGGVERVDYEFVRDRWASPFWRSWDWMMLSLALMHGVIGLRSVVLDYIRRPGIRFAVTWFFYILGFAMFVLGSVIVFTFDASEFAFS